MSWSVASMVLIGVLWGMNWPAVKFMLGEIPPLTIRAVGFPLATVVLASMARAFGHRLRPAAGELWPLIGTATLLVFGFNVFATVGQLYTDTSKAAIIAYTMPAFTAIFAAAFLNERLTVQRLCALTLGLAGLAVLVSDDVGQLRAQPVGPILMLLAALSWAGGNVALKARRWSLSPLAVTAWCFAIATLLCWPLVLLLEPPWRQTWPSTPVAWTLAYHVTGPMVTCYTVWTLLVAQLPATTVAISALLAPVVGVLSAGWLLDEPLPWQTLLALLLILLSIGVNLSRPVAGGR